MLRRSWAWLLGCIFVGACGGAPPPTEPGADCLFDANLTSDRTLLPRCSPYELNETVFVREGATLFIEPGVELRFARGKSLIIGERSGGRLIAQGKEDDPVILRGQQRTEGAWNGLILRPGTLANTNLKNLVIENGGGEQTRGCLFIDSVGAQLVSMENITLRGCAQAGLAISSGAPLSLEGLRIEDSEVGIRVAPKNVAHIPEDTEYEEVSHNLIDQGAVTEDSVWPAQSVPWRAFGDLYVQGSNAPTLTLSPGLTLLFNPGAQMVVGEVQNGALVAEGTEEAPISLLALENPWRGLRLGRTGAGSLQHVTLAGGGLPIPGVSGCLTVEAALEDRVSITDSRFEDCLQAGVGTQSSAVPFAAFSRNTFARCDAGVRLRPDLVGSINADQTYEDTLFNVVTGGQLTSSATWTAQPVPWRVLGPLLVAGQRAPLLTLQAGFHMIFDAGSWLSIGDQQSGGLNAEGEAELPIVLESVATSSATWRGVALRQNLTAATLQHTHIIGAGLSGFGFLGCLTIQSERPNAVRIEDSRFVDCGQSGLTAVSQNFSFSAFTNNRFERAPIGIRMSAGVVGSVTEPQVYIDVPTNQITGGDVRADTTWRAQPVPWEVEGLIRVGSFMDPTLVLEPGLTLGFLEGASLEVGLGGAGSLEIVGTETASISLVSARAPPQAGDWRGLVFGPLTTRAQLSDTIIRHAGMEGALVRGAISLLDTQDRVLIERTLFQENAKADLFVDCRSMPVLSDNRYESENGLVVETCKN